jgi:hypothetical protein
VTTLIRWLIPLAALGAINWLVRQPGWLHTAHRTQIAQVAGIAVAALFIQVATSGASRRQT